MVVAGLGTFVATAAVLEDRSATVEVLVASVDVERGELIDPSSFDVVFVPSNHPLIDQFAEPGPRAEAQAARTIAAGEPLLATDLVAVSAARSPRTFVVPIGDRVVDGLGLVVGDRVDVLAPPPRSTVVGGDGGATMTGEFVAKGLRVARLPTESAGGFVAASSPGFVTVEVTEDELARLVGALAVGEVAVARSTGADVGSEGSGQEVTS